MHQSLILFHCCSQLLLCFCLVSLEIACIIGQAQVTDAIVAHFHGETYALQFWEASKLGPAWSMVASPTGFAATGVGSSPILTLGYLGTMLAVMPLGCCSLDENIVVQLVSFCGMVSGIIVFGKRTAVPARIISLLRTSISMVHFGGVSF